jgi:hypothetical protein
MTQELIDALIPRRSPLRVGRQASLGLRMPWDAGVLAAPLPSQRNPPHLSIPSRYLLALLSLKSCHDQFPRESYHVLRAKRTINFTLKTLTTNFAYKLSNSLLPVELDGH